MTEDTLTKINKVSRIPLKADEVYTFSMKLCDNEVDCDNERFTIDSLHKLAKLFVGTMGSINAPIYDSLLIRYGADRIGKIYDCEVKTEDKTTSYGEVYTYLVAYAYIPTTDSNKCVIEKIKRGPIKDIRMGCSVKKITCNICGADAGLCDHVKGASYYGIKCCGVLENPIDAYEWSFTVRPKCKVKVRKVYKIKL